MSRKFNGSIVYLVNYKDTTIDEFGVHHTKRGVYNYGYKNKPDAIKKVNELADEMKSECVDELGYDESAITTTSIDNGDSIIIECGSNTYEYWVTTLDVI